MPLLIDSTLWVDFFRAKTPRSVKEQVISVINKSDSVLCEPIRFEILRSALRGERKYIEETFATVPLVSSPADLWHKSVLLGQKCLDSGTKVPAIDLLIAQVCLDRGLKIITFDSHFTEIGRVCPLEVWLLSRAT